VCFKGAGCGASPLPKAGSAAPGGWIGPHAVRGNAGGWGDIAPRYCTALAPRWFPQSCLNDPDADVTIRLHVLLDPDSLLIE
jgi:hypothetical protein